MPTRKIYTNTTAQIAGKIATAIISIALIKILTGYLDIDGYGLYSKIYNYLSIFAVIADLGLYTITVRELADEKDNNERVEFIIGNVLTLRAIMGIIIILASSLLAFYLPGYETPLARIGIFIVGIFTLFGLINSSIMSYLQATLQTEKSAIANTGGKLLTFGLIFLFVFILAPEKSSSELLKYTLVLLAGLAGNMLMTGYTYHYASKLVRIRFIYDLDYIKLIMRKSLPYGLALFLNVIFFKIDILLLSLMESRNISDISIALYAVPMKIVEVGMMYGTIFLNSLLPELSRALKEKSGRSHFLIENGFKILFFFGLGISAFLFTFSREILTVISTPEYLTTESMGYTSLDAMRIVCWIFLLYFLSSLATYIMIARSEEKQMIYINGGIALINVCGNLLLIPYYSFYGAAIATVVSQVLLLLCTSWQVRRMIPWKSILPYSLYLFFLAAVCMYLGSHFQLGIWENLTAGSILFSLIYLLGTVIYTRAHHSIKVSEINKKYIEDRKH